MTGESATIAATDWPVLPLDVDRALDELGLRNGDVVLAHVSLNGLGWVCGGPQTVLQSVLQAVGPDGTLVMPGFSTQLSDPVEWQAPPVPVDWHQPILDAMPLFDPDATPTRSMGRSTEAFRAMRATRRSHHPNNSFLAQGPAASWITEHQPISGSLGVEGPLGRLYDLDAKVLFLGTGFDTCTAFHLAEEGAAGYDPVHLRYPVGREEGRTVWQGACEPPYREELFPTIGAAFEASGADVKTAMNERIRSFSMRRAVDFARHWLSKREQNRKGEND